MVGPWIFFIPSGVGVEDLGDIIDLGKLEFNSKLIEVLSSEFTGNATQISYVPANGKTFYHIKSQLKPVVDSIITGSSTNNVTANRRADVEIFSDVTLLDVLTHDMETSYGSTTDGAAIHSQGNAAQTGQYESNTSKSLTGNGVKAFTLVSTNNVGTYRVHMKGMIFDTGVEPSV